MVRGIAVLVSALATASAQAQDARMSKGEGDVAQAVHSPAAQIDQQGIVLASTTPMESRSTLPPRSSPSISPDAGAQTGASPVQMTASAPPDCSVVELLLGDADLATRNYGPPRSTHMKLGDESWLERPAVRRATHCGDRYVLQVRSTSAEPWVLKAVRLEGPNGVVLKVDSVRSRLLKGRSINIIVAEAPTGAGANYTLYRLHLVGEDGRVAVLDQVVLP